MHGGHSIFSDNAGKACASHLSSEARALFDHFEELTQEAKNATERGLRAILDTDDGGYYEALNSLQPGIGPAGQRVLTIYLCKAVQLMCIAASIDKGDVPESLRVRTAGSHSITLNWGPDFAKRFTTLELELLWRRCRYVDERLRHDEEHFIPGYQSGPMVYHFEDVVEPVETSHFVASWK